MASTKRLLAASSVFACVALARPSIAAEEAGPAWLVGGSLVGSDAGQGLSLDGRLRFASGIQLGLLLSGQWLQTGFLAGNKAEDVASGEAAAVALFPILQDERVSFDVRLSSGGRYLRDAGTRDSPFREAARSTTELAFLAHVRLGAHALLRSGAIVGADVQVHPEVELADQTQLLTMGLGWVVSPQVLLFGTLDGGGTYGFDGDNGKAIVRGALGLRLSFGADPRVSF